MNAISRYTEVAKSIATDDDKLIQNVDNLINQQKDVIAESIRHWNEVDDFMRLLKNLRGGITQIVKRHAKVDIDNKEQTTASNHPSTTSTPTTCMVEPCIE